MHTGRSWSRNGVKIIATLRSILWSELALVPVRPTFLLNGPSKLYHTRAALSCRTYPSHVRRNIGYQGFLLTRNIGWTQKLYPRAADANKECMPDGHEDVAKDAILEKVMKGRQLTDLMLRCKSQWRSFLRAKTVF